MNKVNPGTNPGGAETKHDKPGAMPAAKTGEKGNKIIPNNGCWHDGSKGSGTKSRPA